jgi:hypothetical protein
VGDEEAWWECHQAGEQETETEEEVIHYAHGALRCAATRLRARPQPARRAAARLPVKVKDLPQTTEVERLMAQRIGQDIFRTSLID